MTKVPGQQARADFPRFGLPQYATRFPSNVTGRTVEIEINGNHRSTLQLAHGDLPRHTVQSDFHCVTTWTYEGAVWCGVRMTDLFHRLVPESERSAIAGAVFHAQDGYKTTLLLEDLLADDVLLADELGGERLSLEHGAPLRLVAPAHYGYKNVKHLERIAFHRDLPVIKRGISAFLDHPRARVRCEERGRWVPGWMLRYVYRLLIPGAVRSYDDATQQYRNGVR